MCIITDKECIRFFFYVAQAIGNSSSTSFIERAASLRPNRGHHTAILGAAVRRQNGEVSLRLDQFEAAQPLSQQAKAESGRQVRQSPVVLRPAGPGVVPPQPPEGGLRPNQVFRPLHHARGATDGADAVPGESEAEIQRPVRAHRGG